MALLDMREAAFARDSQRLAGPVDTLLQEGERVGLTFATELEASLVALMAAGLVKATSGRVFVDEFDPRIQPVQVKRVVGYVPYEAVPNEFASFERYVEYRAALWDLPPAETLSRAFDMLALLDGVHEAFAYPLVGALLARPRLLVLDRPQSAYARSICSVSDGAAMFSTHRSPREARDFREGCARGAEIT